MHLDLKDFRVPAGHSVHLNRWPTDVKPLCGTKTRYRTYLKRDIEALSALQQQLAR